MNKKPIVWTIAGSDAGGGAGIQADLLTLHDLKVHGCSVITAVTAQNSVAITHIEPLSPHSVHQQLTALASDLPARVIKIGVLANADICRVVGDFLNDYTGLVVVDPVMISTSGGVLLAADAQRAFIQNIIPHATVITPNVTEAKALTGVTGQDMTSLSQAARQLQSMGAQHVLITGVNGADNIDADANQSPWWSHDVWFHDRHTWVLTQPWISNSNTHGTGCTMASAISAALALGYRIDDALVIANMYVHQGIRQAQAIGQGAGPVAHMGWPQQQMDVPMVTDDLHQPDMSRTFPYLGEEPIGFYPVVPDVHWIEKLIDTGITTVQLRIKNQTEQALNDAIKQAVQLCQRANIRLFVNDHWSLAIEHGAFGVHLGQEDLPAADLTAIHRAGLRLGISTHCYFEVARAHAVRPSYIACGPVFATTSKEMPFKPQGIAALRYWRQLLDYPLVAIGGITFDNVASVMATGVDGVAAIGAVTQAVDLVGTTRQLQAMWSRL
jgi:hydroxymethylpyrimidine kinase / phosphomethylpyrimidine kinase / thiamine-phosphate diphosphorylase